MSQRKTPRRRQTESALDHASSSQSAAGRNRRRRRDDDENSDHSGPETPSQAPATPLVKPNAAERAVQKMSDNEIDRKINNLVRLALFMELKKMPLRRDDINKKILGQHTRAFQHVFDSAQTRLRDIFGMEMIELPTREKKTAIGAHGALRKGAAHAKGAANNANAPPTPVPTSSKSYAVRNLLSTQLRCTNVVSMREEEAADYGLLGVVLSLIYVHSQVLAEKQLLTLLEKIGAPPELERRLATFVKQGYLDKPKSDLFQGGAGSQGPPGGAPGHDYVWGPRAKTEWNTDALASFVGNVYGREDRPRDLKKNIEEAGWTENM